ncbi:MAG: ATP12 family chaperone protein [Acuticoccus sp.]
MGAVANGRRGGEAEQPEPLRRFYDTASVGPAGEDGCSVLLDGRPVRTPARQALAAPAAIADAIAAEWNAQATHIHPLTMPLTRLANTAIDGVANAADAVAEEIVAIAGNDLLAYRADHPEGLVARQEELWDPLAADVARRFGVPLTVTAGIMPVNQDARLLAAVRTALPQAPLALTAVHQLTTLTGSALIAVSVADGRLPFADGWEAAHVEEDWNIREWGEDAEAAARRALRRRDAAAAAFVLEEMQ